MRNGEVFTMTMCWKCNNTYGMDVPKCPKCDATNACVDYDKALEEMMRGVPLGEKAPPK